MYVSNLFKRHMMGNGERFEVCCKSYHPNCCKPYRTQVKQACRDLIQPCNLIYSQTNEDLHLKL